MFVRLPVRNAKHDIRDFLVLPRNQLFANHYENFDNSNPYFAIIACLVFASRDCLVIQPVAGEERRSTLNGIPKAPQTAVLFVKV